jgi:hypothetical protein
VIAEDRVTRTWEDIGRIHLFKLRYSREPHPLRI